MSWLSPLTARAMASAAARDDLAEHVSEGGSIAAYARLTGMSTRGVEKMWKRIRDDMGAQAI